MLWGWVGCPAASWGVQKPLITGCIRVGDGGAGLSGRIHSCSHSLHVEGKVWPLVLADGVAGRVFPGMVLKLLCSFLGCLPGTGSRSFPEISPGILKEQVGKSDLGNGRHAYT